MDGCYWHVPLTSGVFTVKSRDQLPPPHKLYIICKSFRSPNLRNLTLKMLLLDKIISPPLRQYLYLFIEEFYYNMY